MKTPIKKLDTRWFLNTQYNNKKDEDSRTNSRNKK